MLLHQFKKLSIRSKRVSVSNALSAKDVEVVRSPDTVAEMIRKVIDEDREQVISILLDIRNQPLGFYLVAVGSIDRCMVDMREVFRAAVMLSSSAIVIAHNHPSGDHSPSSEDLGLTERAVAAGKILGIPVLDHVIVSESGYTSLREQGVLNFL